jgi:hypothetical protein
MAKTKVLEKSGGFVVGGRYTNRRGDYTVLSINSDVVEVRYVDGEKASLSKNVQERIAKNTEMEAKLKAEIQYELEHPRDPIKSVDEYICSFCSIPGINEKCKMSSECKEKNIKLGCVKLVEPKIRPEKIVDHMKAWTGQKTVANGTFEIVKVKSLGEMSTEELKAEIARLEAL